MKGAKYQVGDRVLLADGSTGERTIMARINVVTAPIDPQLPYTVEYAYRLDGQGLYGAYAETCLRPIPPKRFIVEVETTDPDAVRQFVTGKAHHYIRNVFEAF